MTDATFDIAAHLDEVADMVRAASVLSLAWYRQIDNQIDNKASAGFDPVTEADRAVESDLRRRLSERFPGHAILGEEFGTTGDGRYRWIIDPIDGTRAFITGQPMWGTLLGFQDDGRPVAGWMHVPPLNESYVGHTQCSFITADERRTVTVSGTTALAEATLLSTHPTMFATGWEADAFAELADRARLVRYSGDCLNYGLLAMGLADLVVENQLANYDILPLIPIIESAGGVVTDLDGNPPLDGGFVVAAATRELHDAALGLVNAHR